MLIRRHRQFARSRIAQGRPRSQSSCAGRLLAKTQAHGLIGAGNPAAMATHFLAILRGALLIPLLLRARVAPFAGEIESRAPSRANR
jgi:hypothetical protein